MYKTPYILNIIFGTVVEKNMQCQAIITGG